MKNKIFIIISLFIILLSGCENRDKEPAISRVELYANDEISFIEKQVFNDKKELEIFKNIILNKKNFKGKIDVSLSNFRIVVAYEQKSNREEDYYYIYYDFSDDFMLLIDSGRKKPFKEYQVPKKYVLELKNLLESYKMLPYNPL